MARRRVASDRALRGRTRTGLAAFLALACLGAGGCAATGYSPDVTPSMPAPRQALRPEYRFFYDALSDYGDWVLIEPYGYLFRPDVNFVAWRPYTDGYWVPTDIYGNPTPSADIDIVSQQGTTPLVVGFSAAGSRAAPGRTIVSYRWEFEPAASVTVVGGSATSSTVTASFADVGTYSVLLTVTDDRGFTGTSYAPIAPSNVAPVPVVSVNPPVGDIGFSAGCMTSCSGFHRTFFKFSAMVRPVTVRQSPWRKPLSSNVFISIGTPPASYMSLAT